MSFYLTGCYKNDEIMLNVVNPNDYKDPAENFRFFRNL